jgi:hypothetical protein
MTQAPLKACRQSRREPEVSGNLEKGNAGKPERDSADELVEVFELFYLFIDFVVTMLLLFVTSCNLFC